MSAATASAAGRGATARAGAGAGTGAGRGSSSGSGAPAGDRIDPRRLVAFICMVLGMFMALLDIQIVSASLQEIQAGLAASADEITWVQTAYLIAEVVMIPLSGFLGRALSTRVLFAASAAGFTAMSFACGLATSIEEMIVFRALQGFVGGAMIPSVFAASYTIFPQNKRHIFGPIIGLIATLAPTVGPTVGGYLTELLSWHWLFFINIVPGIVVTVAALNLIDFDQPHLKLLKRFDWLGLALMALFLCSLEFVLEEGPGNDWFADRWILVFAGLTVLGGIGFFVRALTREEPIVDLSAFADRNFATGCLLSFIMGIGLYGLTYLYPLFLGHVRHYNSLMIGETVFVSGAAMFLFAPIAGRISAKMDGRIMVAIGFVGLALSSWLMTHMTGDWDFNELLIPQALRGASMMFCIIPINNLALGTLPAERIKNASGLYNLTRNLGGAVGLAAINTVLNERLDLHLVRLHELVSRNNHAALEWLEAVARRFADFGSDANTMALKQLAQMVRAQAYVMSMADVFVVLTALFLATLLTIPFIQKATNAASADAH